MSFLFMAQLIYINFLRIKHYKMQILESIITEMTKEEVRHFKLFATRTSADKERKDILLFDLIRKNTNEKNIHKKLYPNESKNALYRLKNRLLGDIAKSYMLLYFDAHEDNYIMYNIALSRLFKEKQKFQITNYFLRRAEKKAKGNQNFELLDVIYTEYIKLSQEDLSINPEQYIVKRQESRLLLNKLREIDDILAVLIHKIKTSQNFSFSNQPLADKLQNTIDELIKNDIELSPQFQFKIYHSISRILLQKRNFVALEKYLLETLTTFNQKGLFNKHNHDTKLQMLTYTANALFKNDKHQYSLEYANVLKIELDNYNAFLKNKYLFYYYNILVNNYSILDKNKAIEILLEANESEVITKVTFNKIFMQLQLALCYFNISNYKLANKNLITLKLNDGFTTLDEALQLKILITELIIRYELNSHDYIENQIPIINQNFAHLIKLPDYQRQHTILSILELMIYSQNFKSDAHLQKQVKILLTTSDKVDPAENDLLNYNEWIKSKINYI